MVLKKKEAHVLLCSRRLVRVRCLIGQSHACTIAARAWLVPSWFLSLMYAPNTKHSGSLPGGPPLHATALLHRPRPYRVRR